MMRRITGLLITTFMVLCTLLSAPNAMAQRRATPVNTPATRTQPIIDERGDSLRALERRRAHSTHYHDENGNIIMVDTLTGVEWTDSTLLPKAPPMKYPLLQDITVGVDIWDPVMRAFGQKYGIGGVWAQVSLHNRYFPIVEVGLGSAKNKSDHANFTYHSPMAPYFRLGMDYNFLYNSNPDYRFFAGLRYGFSSFKFSLTDITMDDPYWNEDVNFNIPSVTTSAGWVEFGLGLRVRLFANISAGWYIKFHKIVHQTHPISGDAWYIPGFGTKGSALAGSFSITYTIPINKSLKTIAPPETSPEYFDEPQTSIISAPE